MSFKDLLNKVEESKEYKEWKSTHENYYLAHLFLLVEENTGWQIGFSNGDLVASFNLEPIELIPEQEVYKKPGTIINELKIDKLKLSYEEAKIKFDELINEKYPKSKVFKTIVLIQNTNGVNLFNITGVTFDFRTINVKISGNGEVINHSLDELISKMNK